MEPENNIETIIRGHLAVSTHDPLLIIGSYSNNFGAYLRSKYESPLIRFIGPLYDIDTLNNLRYFSKFYFHGHSVGGTNPSLLEAMASNALIIANDNIFNSSILRREAFYFSSAEDIADLLTRKIIKQDYEHFLSWNRKKIQEDYSWPGIVSLLEKYLTDVSKTKKK
jgi:glycosyltransferase involved in cell wall biosynthesis